MLSLIVLTFPPFLFLYLVLFRAVKPRVQSFRRAEDVRRLLNPPNVSLADLLRSRASPNQRLVHAFGLTNTFVSGDIKVHKAFTTHAKALITSAGDKNHAWHVMASRTEESILKIIPAQGTIQFATLIQCVTFSVVLATLFHVELDTLSFDEVAYVTDVINRRWKASKTTTLCSDDDALRELMAYLDRWITNDHGEHEHRNPLDFILPAFETMWRVVAVTVGHVYRFRDNAPLHESVMEFGRDPTEERFVAFGEERPSMETIVWEVLRLYPPTRHIARSQPGGSSGWWSRWTASSAPAIAIADVEGVHLSEEYGENPAKFDPMRIHPARMGKRPELFAFGYGRLRCVAATWAPMAAAVVSATIVSQIEQAGWAVKVGRQMGGRSGWEGWEIDSTKPVLKGSCFCGIATFSLFGPPVKSVYCHCTNCQRLMGCPFVHTIHFKESDFVWSWLRERSLEDTLEYYENPSKPYKRRFRCKRCGSQVASFNARTGRYSVWGANLERGPDGEILNWDLVKPTGHQFYATRMLDVEDGLEKRMGE